MTVHTCDDTAYPAAAMPDECTCGGDTMSKTVGMDQVRRDHRGHWFDPATLRFFRSRVGNTAYESNDGRFRFFVSSERHEYTDPYTYNTTRDARLFSVRVQNVKSGDIGTIGEFQAYESRRQADNAARDYALDPADACSLIVGDGGSCDIHDEYHPHRSDELANAVVKAYRERPGGGDIRAAWDSLVTEVGAEEAERMVRSRTSREIETAAILGEVGAL